jgi:predicted kinase
MKELILLRGLPGSGKSTLAKMLVGEKDYCHVEADMFFMKDGEYKFDATMLKHAHNWCHDVVENWMESSMERIIVSNTFTQEWEMNEYYNLAKEFDYKVFSLIIENRHGGVNTHGVPEEKLQQMNDRFNIKLK